MWTDLPFLLPITSRSWVTSFSPHVPGKTLVTTFLFRSTLWTSRAFLLTLSSERNEQSKPSQHLADSRPARVRLS